MANNHFSFPGTAYHFAESPVFPSGLFASTEDNLADASMSYIDPILQSPSSSNLYLGQWEVSQEQLVVQRYLEDNQKTAFFNADVPSKLTPNRAHNMRPAVGIPPVPRPSPHVRFASPISSPGPSSSSDNMHSPPTDTDSHYEPFGSPAADPATLQLPFQQPTPFDPHWATTHEVQFVGMGTRDTCVNPHDISPNSQPMDCYENESSNLDLSFPQRGYSFESYTTASQCDMEPTSNNSSSSSSTAAALDLPVRRLGSPDAIEPVIKEEINASTHYPPPPPPNHDVETEVSDGEPPLPPLLKRKKTETDDEYKPTNKKPNLNARRQTRRGAGQKSQQPAALSPPAPKKTKTTHTTTTTTTNHSNNIPANPPAAKALPPSSNNGKSTYPCPGCSQPFKDQTLLENHIKKQHTRPFICVFHFAGCPSTFASKNEWKRHVASQHLLLNYWLCDEGPCAGAAPGGKPSTNGPPSALQTSPSGKSGRSGGRNARNHNHTSGAATIDSSSSSSAHENSTNNGVIFNRKDLYTQHVRRMHMPPQIKKSLKQQQQQSSCSSSKKSSTTPNANSESTATTTTTTTTTNTLLLNSEWESRLRTFQSRAIRERCKLPLMMTCPAPHCEVTFHGPESWDQRMEHVARHLEKAASGKEAPVRFGNDGGANGDHGDGDGDGDRCLVDWASGADVGIIKRKKTADNGKAWRWELNPLLKRGSTNSTAATGGSQEIVLLQSGTSSSSSPASMPTSASTSTSGRRKNISGARPTAVRFAPVLKMVEDEDEDEAEIKNEIIVTSSEEEDDKEEKEIVVDGEPAAYEDDDGLRDAEGEEEDDDE